MVVEFYTQLSSTKAASGGQNSFAILTSRDVPRMVSMWPLTEHFGQYLVLLKDIDFFFLHLFFPISVTYILCSCWVLTIWHSGCKQLKIVQYTACSQEEKKCQNKTDHKMNEYKFLVADFDEKTKSY